MYPTINLPRIEDVVPGVDPEHVTDEEDRTYNAHCTALVEEFARANGGTVRTHYPFDREDGSTDDTVVLGYSGLSVVDEGAPL